MKLQKMANIALKTMVKSYVSSDKDCFSFDYFKALFPHESDDSISKSLYLLRDDGLDSDGMIYPFAADIPSANCSKCKPGFLLIIQKLQSDGYITLSSKGVLRLTYDGLHPYQCLWDKLLISVFLPIVISFLTTCLMTLVVWLWPR